MLLALLDCRLGWFLGKRRLGIKGYTGLYGSVAIIEFRGLGDKGFGGLHRVPGIQGSKV